MENRLDVSFAGNGEVGISFPINRAPKQKSRCKIVNAGHALDIGEFVGAIIDTASCPRSKRGNLGYVNVSGSAEDLGCFDDRRYRFIATFMRTYQGLDNQIVHPFSYGVVGVYEGEFDEGIAVYDNLELIRQRLRERDPVLFSKSQVQGKVLAVESAYATIAKM